MARTSARETKRDQGGQAKEAAGATLRFVIAVLIQYGLGAGYNLYGTAPTAKKSLDYFSSPLLALHVILGTLIVLTGIYMVILSVRARIRVAVILSSLAWVCVIGAWASGNEFIQKGQNGFSMSMAMFAGVAILFATINVKILSDAAASSASARSSAPTSNATANDQAVQPAELGECRVYRLIAIKGPRYLCRVRVSVR